MVQLISSIIRILLILLIFAANTVGTCLLIASPADQNKSKIQILITSDIHGWLSTSLIYPDRRKSGLLHIAHFIEEVRKQNPDAVLVDCGDLLQGSPLVNYFNRFWADRPTQNPFFVKFNSLSFDAVVVGNHDMAINPLLESEYIKHSNFAWLGANLLRHGETLVQPYIMLHRDGLKIAVLGITTPGTSMWVPSEQLAGVEIEPIQESLEKWLSYIVRVESPDIIIGVFHAGLNPFRDDISSKFNRISPANGVKAALKVVKGLDIALLGHDHTLIPKDSSQRIIYIGNTPVICGGRWGEAVTSIELFLEKTDDSWRVFDIDHMVLQASQDETIDNSYLSELPEKYKSYILEELPYRFGRTSRRSAEHCFNQLTALANDDKSVVATMLPTVRIYQPRRYFGKKIVRRDLYHWFPYDNRSVVVTMSAREIQMLVRHFGIHSATGKSRLGVIFPWIKKNTVSTAEGRWWLNAEDFQEKYQVLVADYHHQGGGGIFSQFFVHRRRPISYSSSYLREKVYAYLKDENNPLPKSCSFLKVSE